MPAWDQARRHRPERDGLSSAMAPPGRCDPRQQCVGWLHLGPGPLPQMLARGPGALGPGSLQALWGGREDARPLGPKGGKVVRANERLRPGEARGEVRTPELQTLACRSPGCPDSDGLAPDAVKDPPLGPDQAFERREHLRAAANPALFHTLGDGCGDREARVRRRERVKEPRLERPRFLRFALEHVVGPDVEPRPGGVTRVREPEGVIDDVRHRIPEQRAAPPRWVGVVGPQAPVRAADAAGQRHVHLDAACMSVGRGEDVRARLRRDAREGGLQDEPERKVHELPRARLA